MVKINQGIENFIFYTLGRTERDIEAFALSYGLPKGDLTERLSTLLSTTPNGTVLGMSHRVSTVPEETGSLGPTLEPLALGEFSPSHRVHHAGQSISNIEKGSGKRKLTLALLPKLTWPMRQKELRRILREKAGLVKGSIDAVMKWCVEKGHLHRDGSTFMLGQADAGLSTRKSINSAAGGDKANAYRTAILQAMKTLTPPAKVGRFIQATGIPSGSIYRVLQMMGDEGLVEYHRGDVSWGGKGFSQAVNGVEKSPKRPPALPKGEPTRIVMKFMKNGKQLSQTDIVRLLKKKYPNVNGFVWNGVLTNSVRIGKLRKLSNGLLELAGGEHATKSDA